MSSASAYLNFLRDCKRRFGSMYQGQKAVNVAAQRWRAMSLENRAQYRVSDHRSASFMEGIKQEQQQTNSSTLLCREQDAVAGPSAPSVVPSKSSPDAEEGFLWGKSAPSCDKKKRKKSACGKRRRKKSACKKRRSRKRSKSGCSKRRRKSRRSRKSKCKKTC